jgi:L-threonylcarbamoyladenylate synthase
MSLRPAIWRWGDDPALLTEALERHELLALPTESSYALAVDPRSAPGVTRIFELKGRPAERALPVVMGGIDQLAVLGGDPAAPDLSELASLWPAPLTVVVPIIRELPASAGCRTLAVRIPAHAGLRRLLLDLGCPLTATSANPTGETPVCDPARLRELLTGWRGVIVDDGVLVGGAPSTIVQRTEEGYRVLRVGALSLDWLRRHLRQPVFSAAPAEIPADDSRRSR